MKSLLLSLGVLCAAHVNAQTTVFQSDFSSPSSYSVTSSTGTNWVVSGNGPQGINSQSMGAINSVTPTDFALFDSDFLSSISTTQDATIEMTDMIDVSGYMYASVCFQSYYKHDAGTLELHASNDAGATWTTFPVHSSLAQGDSTSNPSTQLIDVSYVVTNSPMAKIRFVYYGPAGYAWMIDDVCMLASNSPTIGLEEYSDDFVKVYPNPTDGTITVDLHKFHGEAEVQVTDLQGRVLMSEIASPSMLTMDLELNEAPGTYFVTVLHDGGYARAPIVKK